MFSDLKAFGLNQVSDDIYSKEKPIEKKEIIPKKPKFTEKDIVFDVVVKCPICNHEIKTKRIRSGKLKLVKTDLDLRPVYDLFDPAKYDVIVCEKCGYAALKKSFTAINMAKVEMFKKKVTSQFRAENYPEIYSFDVAIRRYKLALYDAMVLELPDSEKAYLCLKIAWLYRSKAEAIEENETELIKECKQLENDFLGHALEGFKRTYESEILPVVGLDEATMEFLIGELSRRAGDFEEAGKWIARVLVSHVAQKRLKDRARECKELIKNQISEHR